VLDNADRPTATCPSGDPVAEYRGWVTPAYRGSLLVTSRDRTGWGHARRSSRWDRSRPRAGARLLRDRATLNSPNNLAPAEAALRRRPWLHLRPWHNLAPPDPARVNPPASG